MAFRPPPEQIQYLRLRVAAAIIEDGRVVLAAHQFPGHRRAWLLPGGGVDLGETLIEAVTREAREETGLEVTIGPVIFWREFFDWRYSLELTFLARPVGGELSTGYDPEFTYQVIQEVAWFPLADLSHVEIVPAVLGERLTQAWRVGFEGHNPYLGVTESFAEALRGWRPGAPPDVPDRLPMRAKDG